MLRWMVIGIGDLARKRAMPAILRGPRSRLDAVLTRDPRKAEGYHGVRVYTSLDEALDTGGFDAVYVASPVAYHGPQTMACLRAGRHVLCEKPVARDFSEAQCMTALAAEVRRHLGIAYYRRLFPKLTRAKRLITEGVIGQPVLAEANCHRWLPGSDRGGWLLEPAMAGGGPLYDTASHRIDLFNFLFGRPTRASGLLSNAVHRTGVEDSATLLIGYPGGVHGIVDVRWNSRVPRDQFRVVGTEADIDLDPLGGDLLRCAGREEHWPSDANVQYPLIENFVEAVLTGVPLACSGEEAIWTDWVTERVMRQARSRQ
ncbi:MAG: Gfo/Idh/MocA family oxidoreductase [Candidatus Solibacter sp.]|nr:Gfo/Idh/MocA family oxidoreductase [Candidatus Solibacter sp.]